MNQKKDDVLWGVFRTLFLKFHLNLATQECQSMGSIHPTWTCVLKSLKSPRKHGNYLLKSSKEPFNNTRVR